MRPSPVVERVRRRLEARGLTVATSIPAAVEGRPDDYRLVRSRVVEGDGLAAIPVGPPEPCPEPLAFLDGVERVEMVGSAGVHPVIVAELKAAVRIRRGGHFETVERRERRVIVAEPDALAAAAPAAPEFDPIPLDTDEPAREHPLKALELARRIIDRERGRLERDVGEQFRRRHDAWIIVDGVLTDGRVWLSDARAIGVSKSHATLPFDGPELGTYLTLPAGHRTSVFEPATWRITPVRSFGLRLWAWEGESLLHGLVRIELADVPGGLDQANRIARWILAERVPLSRPDPRWDRLLYGIAGVERRLRTS